MITLELFTSLFPRNRNPEAWVDGLNAQLPTYSIDTPQRVAAFLGICGHETGGFTVTQENLNYSAQGLANTWPKRYATNSQVRPYTPNAIAQMIARNPQAIANSTYASRMGNGDAASGDGWRFRGRGVIQTTGRDNYRTASHHIFGDDRLLEDPDILVLPEFAIASGCILWQNSNLNDLADRGDIAKITQIVNGGMNGFDERLSIYQKALALL